jgi:hypothetical protein
MMRMVTYPRAKPVPQSLIAAHVAIAEAMETVAEQTGDAVRPRWIAEDEEAQRVVAIVWFNFNGTWTTMSIDSSNLTEWS